MYLLGYDIGSSSVKASLLNAENGKAVASAFHPKQEMTITAKQAGWAEQAPEQWWENLTLATQDVLKQANVNKQAIKAIGISYQMHGLVLVDKQQNVLRPSIIWCDSRAVDIGNHAFNAIGSKRCLSHLLNSPGNFTASKLKWVKDNEPSLYKRIYKMMLPGDYIAMKLTGKITTTISGLSEGMLWDFKQGQVADFLMEHYGFDPAFIPDICPTFAVQGQVSTHTAELLGLPAGIPVAYRAGDQPNNALSLNVLKPGEIAATAGTSGVVYGVSDVVKYDSLSRVNTFAHVNHTAETTRLGVLLCVNGTGILNAWLKRNVIGERLSYADMNDLAAGVAIGAEGLSVLPFGNGAERLLNNRDMGCLVHNLNFNRHQQAHLIRAAQEGIVFAFKYGIDIMQSISIQPIIIRAGQANMFQSPVFRETLAGITGATIELYDTDGSLGAARGAGIGTGLYTSPEEAFSTLERLAVIEPDTSKQADYQKAYDNWQTVLMKQLG